MVVSHNKGYMGVTVTIKNIHNRLTPTTYIIITHIMCTSGRVTYLKSSNGCALEAKVSLKVLGNFTDKTLEGKLSDQQLGRLLVSPDLTKGHSTGLVTMRLFDSSSGRSALSGSFGGELFPRSLSSG